MALLDVTMALHDPLFMDNSLKVIRMEQTVGEDGRAVNKEILASFSGVVTSNSGFNLERRPDGSLVSGSITIHTQHRLTEGYAGRDADEIWWRNKRYTVVNTADYSHFGRGFICATCTLKPLAG